MRAGLLIPIVAALLFATTGDARAHGGNWRAPGGPSRPETPEAPAPGRTVPTSPRGGTRPPGGRSGTPRSHLGTGPSRRRTGIHVADWRPGSWETWWFLNREAYLPERATPPSGGAVVTAGDLPAAEPADEGDAAPALHAWGRVVALPYLVRLLDPAVEVDPRVRAAALIAVGRATRHDAPVGWIEHHALDRKACREVRESAVLALGLLRRTHPALRRSPAVLGRVRDHLLEILDDKQSEMRARAFAAFSLALLSDQPYGPGTMEQDGRLITRALWTRLENPKVEPELRIALLTALGHQPPAGVPSTVVDGLRRIATGRARAAWSDLGRAHALAALGRLGAADCLAALRRALSMRGEHTAVHTAAVIAMAERADHMSPEERVACVRAIRKHANGETHWLVRGLGLVTLGALQGADLRAGSTAVLDETDATAHLLQRMRKGTAVIRPFAALGLGVATWHVEPTSRPALMLLEKARLHIASSLQRSRGADELVGALAVAAGLCGAQVAEQTLRESLADTNRDPSLRGHSALSLGMLGRADEATRMTLIASLKERISPFVHLQSARALGLLGDARAPVELVRQLRMPWTRRATLSPVACALGRLKDPKATRVLLDLARGADEPVEVRVACVMALGLTFDPEPRPSRVHLTTHANYPALTWSLAQVFNIV